MPIERLVEDPRSLPEPERLAFRGIGQRLLHFFTIFVLGYDRLGGIGSFHWHVCQRLTNPDRYQFHLYYRGAFKSTIVCIARPLWGAAKDPETYDHIHLVSDLPLGKKQMAAVGRRCERNLTLRTLYPELAPDRNSWSRTEKRIVGRSDDMDGPTWELRTTKQPMAGRHVRAVSVDDIVNEQNYQSRDEQDKLIDQLRRLIPALDTDELALSGTLYADYDAWGMVLREWWPDTVDVFVQPVRGTAHLEPDGVIVADSTEGYAHPEEWNEAKEQRVKAAIRSAFIWGTQYMLDVSQPDSMGLSARWIKRWHQDKTLPALTNFIALDPASGEGARSRPSMAIGGIDEPGQLYMILTEDFEDEGAMIDALFLAFKKYNPAMIGVERYAQGGWGTWRAIEKRMRQENVYLPLQAMTLAATDKRQRIREALRPQYRWGQVWHLPAMLAGEYEAQMQRFPGGLMLDHLDAGAWLFLLMLEHGFQGPSLREEQVAEREKRGEAVTVEQMMEDMLHPDERQETESDFW